jgi:hypothetical protein
MIIEMCIINHERAAWKIADTQSRKYSRIAAAEGWQNIRFLVRAEYLSVADNASISGPSFGSA